jgi:putative SOS response-associated peptidase YedK
MLKWGLIPFWAKDEKTADEIRMKTFNARAETVFEKASFKSPIKNKRCIVIVSGFYEWRLVKGKNYPYHIISKDENAFALAGIWESWKNKDTEEKLNTFSIITTRANPLLEKIHNKKKRMPVILRKEDERTWLKGDLDVDEIKSLLEPIEDTGLEAYTVSRLISFKKENSNVPEVMKRYEYEELKTEQTKLF